MQYPAPALTVDNADIRPLFAQPVYRKCSPAPDGSNAEADLKGLQTRNITHLEEAVPVYNEFLALMKENQDKFKRIR